ncbi:hypothetical protein [Serinicoccus sp. LYQ131]|uniref:hypothetical protein n=1 Tax=Serinicoccus sp. LYQ131 TaxID=3378797 RepID=UPI0038535BC7
MATQPIEDGQDRETAGVGQDHGDLATLLERVGTLQSGVQGMGAGECLEVLEALHRLGGVVDAVRVDVIAQLAARTGEDLLARAGVGEPGELSPTGRERWRGRCKSLAATEVATLTGMGRWQARQLVAVALAPKAVSAPVREGLVAGVVTWGQVEHFWRRAGGLPHEHAADVATALFATGTTPDKVAVERLTTTSPDDTDNDRGSAGGVSVEPWPAKVYVEALEREVTRAQGRDPVADAARRAQVHRGRCAYGVIDDDGTGQVVITGDAASTAACVDRLHVLARRSRLAGDARTETQLRSDIGRALLLHGTLPLPDLTHHQPEDADQDVDLTSVVSPEDIASLAQIISGTPTYDLQVVVPWDATTNTAALAVPAASADAPPGPGGPSAPGGEIVSGVGRLVGRFPRFFTTGQMRQMLLAPGTTLHRVLTDPADGRCLERTLARYTPDTAMRTQVAAADLLSRAPGQTLPVRDGQLDHVHEYLLGGATSEVNLQGLDTVFHALKTQKFWHAQIDTTRHVTWTSFFDRTYRTRAHDYTQYLTTATTHTVDGDTESVDLHEDPQVEEDTRPRPGRPLSADARSHLASLLVYAALAARQRGAPLEARDDDPDSDTDLIGPITDTTAPSSCATPAPATTAAPPAPTPTPPPPNTSSSTPPRPSWQPNTGPTPSPAATPPAPATAPRATTPPQTTPTTPGATNPHPSDREPAGQRSAVSQSGSPTTRCHLAHQPLRRRTPAQSSGSAAKAAFMSLYQPSDFRGRRQRAFISSRAGWWLTFPAFSASLRCLSWAAITSSWVSPRCPRSQGPPSWRQVIVFIPTPSVSDQSVADRFFPDTPVTIQASQM